MKKVSDYLKSDYSLIRLYLDDIHEINEVLEQFSKDATWSTDKYSYDSFEEFIKENKVKEIKNLEIQTSSPFVRIRLLRDMGELSVVSNEIAHDGLFNKLDRILSAREFKMAFLFDFKFFWIALMFFFILAFGFKVEISGRLYFTIFGLFFFIQAFGSFLLMKRNTIIRMTKKEDEKGFFARNKDQIILLILGGILGSVLTMLVDYFKNR